MNELFNAVPILGHPIMMFATLVGFVAALFALRSFEKEGFGLLPLAVLGAVVHLGGRYDLVDAFQSSIVPWGVALLQFAVGVPYMLARARVRQTTSLEAVEERVRSWKKKHKLAVDSPVPDELQAEYAKWAHGPTRPLEVWRAENHLAVLFFYVVYWEVDALYLLWKQKLEEIFFAFLHLEFVARWFDRIEEFSFREVRAPLVRLAAEQAKTKGASTSTS